MTPPGRYCPKRSPETFYFEVKQPLGSSTALYRTCLQRVQLMVPTFEHGFAAHALATLIPFDFFMSPKIYGYP